MKVLFTHVISLLAASTDLQYNKTEKFVRYTSDTPYLVVGGISSNGAVLYPVMASVPSAVGFVAAGCSLPRLSLVDSVDLLFAEPVASLVVVTELPQVPAYTVEAVINLHFVGNYIVGEYQPHPDFPGTERQIIRRIYANMQDGPAVEMYVIPLVAAEDFYQYFIAQIGGPGHAYKGKLGYPGAFSIA